MKSKEIRFLKKVYSDIIRGYSYISYKNKSLYIKHFNVSNQCKVDDFFDESYDYAIENGLATEKTRLDALSETGDWTYKDEAIISQQKSFIQNLQTTKKSLSRKSDIDGINLTINESMKIMNKKLIQKMELVGLTAEKFAENKLNSAYLFASLFKDSALTTPFFSEIEFEEIDTETFDIIEQACIQETNYINRDNVRKIALAAFFQNVFILCDNDPFRFFGKSLVDLTFNQCDLFLEGRYFRSILENENPPEELLYDPDRLIDWITGAKNMKKQVETGQEGGATTLVGASVQDLKDAGLMKEGQVTLSSQIHGKKLNMEQLRNLLNK